MTDRTSPSRRDVLASATALTAAASIGGSSPTAPAAEIPHPDGQSSVVKNGRINHSVCLWCYKGMKSSDMAPVAKRLGLKAIDLLTPKEWAPLKENGLICSMTSGVWGGITKGLNRPAQHEHVAKPLTEHAHANAEQGSPNVISFSGNRAGQDDEEGIKICAEGIQKVIGHYEQKKVTLGMELLNSKVNHADY